MDLGACSSLAAIFDVYVALFAVKGQDTRLISVLTRPGVLSES